MKLTDAMARGRQEMEWTINVLDRKTETGHYGCALGLAAVGLGASSGLQANRMTLNGGLITLGDDTTDADDLWDRIATLNNKQESYEDAVLALKAAGLDQVEVALP